MGVRVVQSDVAYGIYCVEWMLFIFFFLLHLERNESEYTIRLPTESCLLGYPPESRRIATRPPCCTGVCCLIAERVREAAPPVVVHQLPRLAVRGERVALVVAVGAHRRLDCAAVDRIDWPEGFCRRDIGWRAIAREDGQ